MWRWPSVVVPATAESGSLISPGGPPVLLSLFFDFFRNGQRENRLLLLSAASSEGPGVSQTGSGADMGFPGGGGVSRKKSISSSPTSLPVVFALLRLSVSERSISLTRPDELENPGADWERLRCC
jgi:hypothetical protein